MPYSNPNNIIPFPINKFLPSPWPALVASPPSRTSSSNSRKYKGINIFYGINFPPFPFQERNSSINHLLSHSFMAIGLPLFLHYGLGLIKKQLRADTVTKKYSNRLLLCYIALIIAIFVSVCLIFIFQPFFWLQWTA